MAPPPSVFMAGLNAHLSPLQTMGLSTSESSDTTPGISPANLGGSSNPDEAEASRTLMSFASNWTAETPEGLTPASFRSGSSAFGFSGTPFSGGSRRSQGRTRDMMNHHEDTQSFDFKSLVFDEEVAVLSPPPSHKEKLPHEDISPIHGAAQESMPPPDAVAMQMNDASITPMTRPPRETVMDDGTEVPFFITPQEGRFAESDDDDDKSYDLYSEQAVEPSDEVATSPEHQSTSTSERAMLDQDAMVAQDDAGATAYDSPKRPRRAAAVRAESQLAAEYHYETAAPQPPPDDEYYVEETSWRYYNPPVPGMPGAVASKDLLPLGPAPPLPDFPNTGKCKWSFDETTRVLLANFIQDSGEVELTYEDEKFLLTMMERDDISCVSDGLARNMDPGLYDMANIVDACGDEFFHKFRRFDQEEAPPEKKNSKGKKKKATGDEQSQSVDLEKLAETIVTCKYQETDGLLSMKVADFARYLSMQQDARKRMDAGDAEAGGAEKTEFRFVDHNAKEHVVDVRKCVLYMIDFDVVKLLPKLHEALLNKFELPGCLPGGLHCMMNSINVNGRPFMGPNAYCTPPESFTQVHQDGHGTVDSGHLCLSGYNEVVMLRRMPERHKIYALSLLRGEGGRGAGYDGLYSEPHADQLGEKPDWPLVDGIEECEDMNYYPSVFILKPGQLVHINKGRLHAFRKLSPMRLPARDCHFDLRSELLAELGTTSPEDFLCFSIAWDWMYRGVTSEGVCREVVATLECAILNRLHERQSLAIPELTLLQMARTMTPAESNPARTQPLSSRPLPVDHNKTESGGYVPSKETILRGLLPGLRYVVNSHASAAEKAEAMANRARAGPRVSIAKRPNSWENPQTFSLDPYGSSDFFCKLCSKELSNVYMHCDGCEVLLSKDFNICVDCHAEGRYKDKIPMHPLNPKRHSLINHTGDFSLDRQSRCPCKNGPVCKQCNYCAGCSCKCHQWFTLHRRFFNTDDENALVRRVEAVLEGDTPLPFSEEVKPRLDAAAWPVLPSKDSVCLPVATSQETGDNDAVVVAAAAPPPPVVKQSKKRPPPRDRSSVQTSTTKRRKKESGEGEATKNASVSQAGASDEWDVAMVQSRLRSFDEYQRPNDLRPIVCSPSQPSSRYDLSDGALAFTEPKGNLPPTDRDGKVYGIDGVDPQDLVVFLEKARQLTQRTPGAMLDLLPHTCNLSEDGVRHLFRNFADTGNVRCDTKRKSISVFYSLREIEILLYGCLMDLTQKDVFKLLPYRLPNSGQKFGGLAELCRDVDKWGAGLKNCDAYKQHLEGTVGQLFRLEGVVPKTASIVSEEKPSRGRRPRQKAKASDSMSLSDLDDLDEEQYL